MNVKKTILESKTKPHKPYADAARVFPYTYGGRLAYHLFKKGGTAESGAWYADQRLDTLAYMVSVDGIVNPEPVPVTVPAPTPVTGNSLLFGATLGAWLVYEMFRSVPASSSDPDSVVSGWRGDRLWVYGSAGSSDVVAIWRTTWDSASAASAFVTRAQSASATVQGTRSTGFASDQDGVVVVSSGGGDLSAWVAAAKAPPSVSGADGGVPVAPGGAGAGGSSSPDRVSGAEAPRWISHIPRSRR
jgi:hypothetical protein